MTLKEFYVECDGDYDDVFSRLRSDERIVKYLKMFLMDDSYQKLAESVKNNDVSVVFASSHNLKGMSANLGLSALRQAASDICEETRSGNPTRSLVELMEKITAAYDKVASGIHALEA